MVWDSSDEANFPHKFLSTDTQVSRLFKVFANNSLAYLKLLKTKLPNLVQLGGFLDRFLEPLLKPDLHLMKNELKQLAEFF